MKFIVSLLLTALLSFAACLYLPWWSIAPAAFLVTLFIFQRPVPAFFSAFLALFFLWTGLAWFISSHNDHILAHKVSVLFIQTDSVSLLLLLTGFIGALIAGLASLAASFLRGANSRNI